MESSKSNPSSDSLLANSSTSSDVIPYLPAMRG